MNNFKWIKLLLLLGCTQHAMHTVHDADDQPAVAQENVDHEFDESFTKEDLIGGVVIATTVVGTVLLARALPSLSSSAGLLLNSRNVPVKAGMWAGLLQNMPEKNKLLEQGKVHFDLFRNSKVVQTIASKGVLLGAAALFLGTTLHGRRKLSKERSKNKHAQAKIA